MSSEFIFVFNFYSNTGNIRFSIRDMIIVYEPGKNTIVMNLILKVVVIRILSGFSSRKM